MREEDERRWEVVGSETGDISKRSDDAPRSWTLSYSSRDFKLENGMVSLRF